MSTLIAITGMDGSGKNALIHELQRIFPESRSSEIWDPMKTENTLFSSKQAVDQYICSLSPKARSLFLTHALLESINQKLENESKLIFLNAYYYKYFAAELALGTSEKFIRQLIEWLPEPDLTIRLTCEPEVAAQRKSIFSRYECGLAEKPSQEAFVMFQKRCEPSWNQLIDPSVVEIDNSGLLENTIQQISALIRPV